MNEEKRRHKRFVLEEVEINAKTIVASEIEILDISIGGACIKSTKPLKLGGKYLIKLESEGIIFPVICAVIWENLSGTLKNAKGKIIPFYKAGIEFKDISSDELPKLKRFIEISGSPYKQEMSIDKRLDGLRFKININKKAFLD